MNHEFRIPRQFYQQDTVKVARNLLGKILVRKVKNHVLSGIITETEAYRHTDDPASHAYKDITPRNSVMFGQVGCAYVYFTYGMHYCINVVARSKNYKAGAVLIRSLRPLHGIRLMMKHRNLYNVENLTNGPAKLTEALLITKNENGVDLVTSDFLYIVERIKINGKVTSSPRVGIKSATDKLWNFKLVFNHHLFE